EVQARRARAQGAGLDGEPRHRLPAFAEGRARAEAAGGRAMTVFAPADADEVLDAVRWAAGEGAGLEIVGGGSRRGVGRPVEAGHILDLSALAGVTLYEPEELVLSARAG